MNLQDHFAFSRPQIETSSPLKVCPVSYSWTKTRENRPCAFTTNIYSWIHVPSFLSIGPTYRWFVPILTKGLRYWIAVFTVYQRVSVQMKILVVVADESLSLTFSCVWYDYQSCHWILHSYQLVLTWFEKAASNKVPEIPVSLEYSEQMLLAGLIVYHRYVS